MKTNIFLLSLILAGTAGVLLLSPKKLEQLKNCSLIKELINKTKVRLEPEKINFC